MRTSGKFQDVFNAAKNYMNNSDDDCPINPVVRREGDVWMLESSLEPTDGDIEVTLDDFQSYWYESMQDDYTPTDDDIEDYVNMTK
jgi:hypothetical protein